MVYDISAVSFLFFFVITLLVTSVALPVKSSPFLEPTIQTESLDIKSVKDRAGLFEKEGECLKTDAPFDPLPFTSVLEIHLHQLYPMNCVWNPQVPLVGVKLLLKLLFRTGVELGVIHRHHVI